MVTIQPETSTRGSAGSDSTCDLCGTTRSRVVAEASDSHCRTVLCDECGLLYAAPGVTPTEMEQLYDGEFTGDAGSHARAVDGLPAEHRIRVENKRANNWAVKIAERYLPLQGQRLLELRCRSGALSEALIARGAQVVSIDPFAANLRYAVERRGLTDVLQIPISRLHRLEVPDTGPVDAVVALTEHVPGHLLSPRAFMHNALERLVPGGYLILDEKDVLHPRKFHCGSTFDTGRLHQFQLTPRTLTNYARAAGFEIVACEIDTKRRSFHRHFHLVARKPVTGSAPEERPWSRAPEQVEAVRRRLKWLERTWRLRRAKAAVKRTTRKLVGRVS